MRSKYGKERRAQQRLRAFGGARSKSRRHIMPEHESLQGLYPFLHGGRQDADKLDAALLESVRQKALDSVDTKRRVFEANGPAVVAVAQAIAGVYRHDGRLFTMGNG